MELHEIFKATSDLRADRSGINRDVPRRRLTHIITDNTNITWIYRTIDRM